MSNESSITTTARREWFEFLSEHCTGSSGYGGSLAGMRKQFWGNAYVVRCCGYLFRVDYNVFSRIKFQTSR